MIFFDKFALRTSHTYALFASASIKERKKESFMSLRKESKDIVDFQFAWFTDGLGWNGAKHNLEETFDVLNNLYNLQDLENGAVDILTDSTKYFKQMIK